MKKILLLLLTICSLSLKAQTVFIKPEASQLVTTGSAVTVTTGVGLLRVNPASTMAALAITFPTSPNDRDILVISFGGTVSTGTVVTLLSFVGSTVGTVPTTAISGSICWLYDATISKWVRLF